MLDVKEASYTDAALAEGGTRASTIDRRVKRTLLLHERCTYRRRSRTHGKQLERAKHRAGEHVASVVSAHENTRCARERSPCAHHRSGACALALVR